MILAVLLLLMLHSQLMKQLIFRVLPGSWQNLVWEKASSWRGNRVPVMVCFVLFFVCWFVWFLTCVFFSLKTTQEREEKENIWLLNSNLK